MKNGYITEAVLDRKIEDLKQFFKNEMATMFKIHLSQQEEYIKTRMDSIGLIATISSGKALDVEVELLKNRVSALEKK